MKGVPYELFALFLSEINGQFIFIDDACYSFSAEKPLKRHRIIPYRCLFIPFSDKEIGHNISRDFLNIMLGSYREGERYNPESIIQTTGRIILDFPEGNIGRIYTDPETGYEIEEVLTFTLPQPVEYVDRTITHHPPKKIGADLEYLLMPR